MSTASTVGLQFLQISILAHLLPPGDFGLMREVLVVIGFSQAFADLGVSNAIIHRQDITGNHLSSLYWLNVFSGAAVFVLIIAVSPLIILLFGEPRLTGLIGWAALVFPIASLGHPFQMLMQKELQFGRLSRVEVGAFAIGMGVAVLSALGGQGVFSFIWGQLASAAARTFCLVTLGWRTWHPGLRFRKGDLKGYLRFGSYQMGERSINYLSSNMDYIVIGRFLGLKILGAYTVAYELVVLPIIKINPILTRVAFPVFAKKQTDDASLRRGYLEMTRLLGFVIFPALIGLGVTSPFFVPLFLGDGWGLTASLVPILIPVGISRALGNPLGSILLAKGRVDVGFIWNLFPLIVYSAVFWSIAQNGVYAVAWSYAVLNTAAFIVAQFILKWIIGLDLHTYFSGLIRPFAVSMGMGVLLLAARAFLAEYGSDRLALQLVLTLLGVCFYGGLTFLFDRPFLREIWGWIGHRPGACGKGNSRERPL